MYNKQILEINKDLDRTGKAIISLGCSFVQGQGAFNDELYLEYEWKSKGMGYPLEIVASEEQKKTILKKYNNVFINNANHELDFTFMEYDNAFVNVLCKKYFNGEYTPINFGIRGCGNRATIKELYFHPDINWSKIKEIIVIYCPSGVERFDFVNDSWPEHFHWKAMWPHYENNPDNPRNRLWEGYGKTLWSDKFGAIEQIAHVQELMSWCNLNNAKLIITPGFDRRYSKKEFEKVLSTVIKRDINGATQPPDTNFFSKTPDSKELVHLFPWDKMFAPAGHSTFIDLVMAQENIQDRTDHFFQFLEKGSPDKWITPCSHPAAKAHDLFAKLLHGHITK